MLAGVAGEGVWCVLTGVAGKRVSGVCWQVLQKRGVSCVLAGVAQKGCVVCDGRCLRK